MRFRATTLLACLLLSLQVWAQGPQSSEPLRFTINQYRIDGNTLISNTALSNAVAPYTGPQRDFGDVQRALEALEQLYRQAGYTTVYVTIPEQELNGGIVRIHVVEGRLGSIKVEGNQHFSEKNIRASLPSLVEGSVPQATRMSENIQLANENPAKQVEVLLGVGEEEGVVDARIKTTDQNPFRIALTADNSGSTATGTNRTGVYVQHHNVGDRDQSFTAAYLTSLNKPSGVNVDVYSLGYRLPLYRWGDSIDLIYANSSTGVPSNSPTLGSALGITGKGEIYGLRWNHLFPRQGEYSSRLVATLDEKRMDSSCVSSGGIRLTGVAGCEPYRVRPFSLSYLGRYDQATRSVGFSAGVSTNLDHSGADSYTLASSNRPAPLNFLVARMGANLAQAFAGDWQVRLNTQAQFANDPLVPTEQIGLAGSNAVRGFLERIVATDRGYFVQNEVYTPDLASRFSIPGNLRALTFYDYARGKNLSANGDFNVFGIASAGIGLRYNYARDISWRFDLARIIDNYTLSSGALPSDRGWRGHFGLSIQY